MKSGRKIFAFVNFQTYEASMEDVVFVLYFLGFSGSVIGLLELLRGTWRRVRRRKITTASAAFGVFSSKQGNHE
jgi:hypothetical protein